MGAVRTMLAAISAVAVLGLGVVTSCGGDDGAGAPAPSSTATPAPTTTSVPPPSTTVPYPASTVHEVPAVCDAELDEMLVVVDESMSAGRLAVGDEWQQDTDLVAFDDRTHTAEEFRYRLGLDCAIRMAQTTTSGHERLVLAAWTGERRAWVVQATDEPTAPYRADQRVQLFIEQPDGEWLEEGFTWAGSLDAGDTVIVGTVDTSFGVAAKAWWSDVPRFDDLEVTIAAERYAIDALVQAGARNVSVAEPAAYQSEMAAVQFVTPLGLHLIATIAPPDWFDPTAPIVEGDVTIEQIDGVDVHVTTAVPESYAVGSVGWACGDFVWFIDAAYGTVGELTDWARQLISSTGC